ncbi:hypothetical protein ACLMJK_006170 [Lecanora helva]
MGMNRGLTCTIVQGLPYVATSLYVLFLLGPKAGISFPFESSNEKRADTQSETSSESAAQLLKQQFINPSEIFSVLLIIGGDIVQKACAQLSGGPKGLPITPVAFSFGWVAFAFGALMSAFGDGSLMPVTDITSTVAVVGGQRKTNESWVLGRLIRDLELDNKRYNEDNTPKLGGLSVRFYRTSGKSCAPHRDWIWKSFGLFIPLQLGVAAAPMYHRNWSILMITAFGTALALTMGSLPQWRAEKFHGRMRTGGQYVLTRGNGHSHAFVIRNLGEDTFITLDDLAITRPLPDWRERAILVTLAVLWITLLITVGGTKEDTWFLLGVGVIGMTHNVVVAGFRRQPKAHGIPIVADETLNVDHVDADTVFSAIQQAEEVCPGVGVTLIPSFYPDGLRPDQQSWLETSKSNVRAKQEQRAQAVPIHANTS